MPRRPGYTEDANDAVTAIKNKIEGDVRYIAERLAKHEGTEKVLRAHVTSAYSALAHLGLQRKRFYRRTEFEAVVGGIFWAAAGLCPVVLDSLWGPAHSDSLKAVLITILAVSGTGLCLHAFIRGLV